MAALKEELSKLSVNYNEKGNELKVKAKELDDANLINASLVKDLESLKVEINNEPSTSTGFKGFTTEDKMSAIEDLISIQGKSMKIMTDSFKSVIQEPIVIKRFQKESVVKSLPNYRMRRR